MLIFYSLQRLTGELKTSNFCLLPQLKSGILISLLLSTVWITAVAQDQQALRNELFVLELNSEEISIFLSKLEAIASPTAEIVSYTGEPVRSLQNIFRTL